MREPHDQIPLDFMKLPRDEMVRRAVQFNGDMQRRRTVRSFGEAAVDETVIRHCVQAAGSAPSGANQQPWHFAVIADATMKHRIRVAAEEEEREFYGGRATEEWLDAIGPLGTDSEKPFLETAPYLIVIFAERYSQLPNGSRSKHYYVNESVGIATGILITALHQSGLATLTHTPAPMTFLNEIIGRPENERPYLILVVGHPAESATVPKIERKSLGQISSWH